MDSPQKLHLQGLDELRGIAIASVFVFHCLARSFGSDQVPWAAGLGRDFSASTMPGFLIPFTYGWAGVPLFFVVSGFCIHLASGFSARFELGPYLVRRLFRVYVPFLGTLILFAYIVPTLPSTAVPGFSGIYRHLLLLHNLGPASVFAYSPAYWSIAVEFQLYLFYPILLAGSKRFGWPRALVLTAIVEIGLRTAAGPGAYWFDIHLNAILPYSPFYFVFTWTLGAYLAECLVGDKRFFLKRVPWFVWLFAAVAADLIKTTSAYSWLLFGVTSATLIATQIESLQEGKTALRNRAQRSFGFIGQISYSVYLLHQPFLLLLGGHLSQRGYNPLAIFALSLLLFVPILTISVLYFHAVEQTANQWGRKLSRALSTARSGVYKVAEKPSSHAV